MEELRTAILNKMKDELSGKQFRCLENAIDSELSEYNITKKSRELSLNSDNNEIIIKNFLGTKLLEGCSKKTITHYKGTVERMLDDVGKSVSEISTDDMRRHMAMWQMNRNVSTTTLNNMRLAYSTFFRWCFTEGITKDNPMKRIKPFKTQKKEIKPFTEKELETLCDSCKNTRDRALIEFLYSTGCRVSECSDCNISDIDFQRSTVVIHHGKGDKERTCYISEKCMYWLEKYLINREDGEECLWYGRHGRLTKNGIESIIRKIGESAHIKANPHKFRHTLASDMIKRNAPIQIVQKILGHEDVNTTMIYVSLDKSDIESTHRKLIT